MTDQANSSSRTWRSYLRLRLRGLIVFIAAVAFTLGWIVHFARSARSQRGAYIAIQAAGGSVTYDYRRVPQAPWWPEWLENRLGVDCFANIVEVFPPRSATEADLWHIGHLKRLEFQPRKSLTTRTNASTDSKKRRK